MGKSRFIRILFTLHLLLILVIINGCNKSGNSNKFPYRINEPTELLKLPEILAEISGLAYSKPGVLYCVQDEDGLLFQYDLKQKKVVNTIKFAKDNDYEGIALVDSTIFITKSNGTLYTFRLPVGETKIDAKKISTFLDSDCNAEGLCYDEEGNQLLIACKTKGKKTKKAIYRYNLSKNKLQKKPKYLIDREGIKSTKNKEKSKFKESNKLEFESNNKLSIFPSGIAIHPFSKEMYILSARGNKLLVLSEKGAIHHILYLNKADFNQPEGITFDEKGTLYIANEGKDGKANILVYDYLE